MYISVYTYLSIVNLQAARKGNGGIAHERGGGDKHKIGHEVVELCLDIVHRRFVCLQCQ